MLGRGFASTTASLPLLHESHILMKGVVFLFWG